MKLNTRQWKKVKAEGDFTHFQDDKGNELKIHHKTLSPKFRSDLAALPMHMAAGGEVTKNDDEKKIDQAISSREPNKTKDPLADIPTSQVAQEPALPVPAASQQEPLAHMIGAKAAELSRMAMNATPAGAALNALQGASTYAAPIAQDFAAGFSGEPVAQAAEAPAPPSEVNLATPEQQAAMAASPQAGLGAVMPPPQVAQQPQAPTQDVSAAGLLSQSIADASSGLHKEADAQKRLGQAEAKALEVSVADQQALAKDFETKHAAITSEINNVVNDLRNGHIDPNRIWAERGTLGKIGTVIGLLAGGLATQPGGENQAVKILHSQIDRDIDAQKADLNNKHNVLGALSTQLGSLRAGTEMLRAIKLSAVGEQMKLAAAQIKDPMAQANMLKSMSDVKMKAAEIAEKLAKDSAKGVMTPAQKAVDEHFAKDYNEWVTTNKATYDKNLSLLESSMKTLEKRKNDVVGTSGRMTGRLPDAMRSEESIRLRDDVQKAALAGIRAALGPQFTKEEGERVQAGSYNEKLSAPENIKKVKLTIAEIKERAQNMEDRSKYYEQNGTLKGWQSPKSGDQEKQLVDLAKRRLQINPKDEAARGFLQRRGIK